MNLRIALAFTLLTLYLVGLVMVAHRPLKRYFKERSLYKGILRLPRESFTLVCRCDRLDAYGYSVKEFPNWGVVCHGYGMAYLIRLDRDESIYNWRYGKQLYKKLIL